MASAPNDDVIEETAAPAVGSVDEPSDPKRQQPYVENDIIHWDDEEKRPDMWEITPKHAWEKEERGYIFETRLETADVHKTHGNTHFHASEWDLALRRYKRAIYFCHFDEMQMHDLMEHHTAQVQEIQYTSKLNLVACIVKMYEMDHPDLPEGSLDHGVEAINDVLKFKSKEPKVHFRRGQVLMLQQDLPGAREALNQCHKCGGGGQSYNKALATLRELERAERERARSLYGGKIQKAAVHPEIEARQQRRERVYNALRFLVLPLTSFWQLLLLVWVWATGGSRTAKPKAA